MTLLIFAATNTFYNATLSDPTAIPLWLAPFAEQVYAGISKLSWYVGGIFGLYVIFMLVGYIQKKQLNKRISKIENDLRELKEIAKNSQAQLDSIIVKLEQASRPRQLKARR